MHVSAPKGDDNFRWESAAKAVRVAAEVDVLHGAETSLRIDHPDCKHSFLPESRAKAYKHIDEVLKQR